jgi:hypothetical protein
MPNAKLYQLIMLIIVAACTTQPNKVASAGPDIQCHPEATTGSIITKSVCTTRAQRAANGRQLDALEQSVQAGADQVRPTK